MCAMIFLKKINVSPAVFIYLLDILSYPIYCYFIKLILKCF